MVIDYMPAWSNQFLVFPQSLTGMQTFQTVTSNIPLKALCYSRTNYNIIYGIGNSDGLLYRGRLDETNNITFKRVQQVENPYNWISSASNPSTSINSALRTFTISNQQALETLQLNNQNVSSIAKNEESSQFLIPNSTSIVAYNENLVSQYTLELAGVNALFVKPADDIDVPNVSIYDLQHVVDSINIAFLDAFTRLTALGGTLPEAPTMVLNANGTLTLNYGSVIAQSGNGILFNNALKNLCYFQNVADTQDVGFYRLVLNPSSTSITQLAKSLYQFNQLDKILIQSTSLFVAGSWYGNNSISQVLTDIDVPIDSDTFAIGNIGQVLYYQPNMLRVYQMASGGNAVNRIQMSILYRYRNGTQYIVELSPGEAFSVKLEFIKKF
jgi:hypothetical protein